eukprot:s111_g21.t1
MAATDKRCDASVQCKCCFAALTLKDPLSIFEPKNSFTLKACVFDFFTCFEHKLQVKLRKSCTRQTYHIHVSLSRQTFTSRPCQQEGLSCLDLSSTGVGWSGIEVVFLSWQPQYNTSSLKKVRTRSLCSRLWLHSQSQRCVRDMLHPEESDSSDGLERQILEALKEVAGSESQDSSRSSIASLSAGESGSEEPIKEGSMTPEMKVANMKALHLQGKCTPCRYFRFREDGCRQGDSCSFCHECTAEESLAGQRWLKHQRQREKRRQHRRQAWQ